MKQLTYFIAVFTLAVMASCTKKIDVNFDNAPAKVVVEGKINKNEYASVYLTKTLEVDQPQKNPPISGAIVVIADNMGNTETLSEVEPGLYHSSNLKGVEGRTYTLKVTTEGTTYTAQSTMPKEVPVDSLSIREFGGFGGSAEFVIIHYTDPIEMGNNYRAVLYVNDTLIPDIFIEDDIYINGNTREAVLWSDEYELKPGDNIRAEINCLDRPVYEYLWQLYDVAGNSEVAAPSNPITNINNGALGYFSAQTSSVKQMVAP